MPAGGAAGKASVAAVPVPDPRVDVLSELERSRKRVFVQARFVDVAGLSAGGPGGGLAAQGLGALREADALAMVLAAWDEGGPDPVEAAAELTLELTVADLESVAGGAEKAAKKARAGVKDAALEAEVLARARDLLDQGTPLRAAGWEPEEARVLRNFAPLTLKPALAVLNLAEADAAAAAERAAEAEAKLGLPDGGRGRRPGGRGGRAGPRGRGRPPARVRGRARRARPGRRGRLAAAGSDRPSSPPARTRPGPGRSTAAPPPPRPPAASTPTSSAASSAPR